MAKASKRAMVERRMKNPRSFAFSMIAKQGLCYRDNSRFGIYIRGIAVIAPKTTPAWRLPLLLTSLAACLLCQSLPTYGRTAQKPSPFHKNQHSTATKTQKPGSVKTAAQKTPSPVKTAAIRPDGLSERLNRIERCVVGSPHRELDFNRRLGALEIEIFGNPKLGGAMSRLQALERAVGTSSSASTYLPPVAPQLDAGVRGPQTPPSSEVATARSAERLTPARTVERDVTARSAERDVAANGPDSATPIQSLDSLLSETSSQSSDADTTAKAEASTESDTRSKIAAASPTSDESTRISQHLDRTPAKANEKTNFPTKKNDEKEIAEMLRKGLKAHNDGHDDDAEKSFKEVLVLSPFNPDAYYNLGAIAEKKGDLVTALGNYRTALIAHPDDRQLQSAVAQIEDQIAHKQGGVFQNPVVFKNSDKTILRGNASDFELQQRALGARQTPSVAPYYPPQNTPYTAQANQRALRAPVVPVSQSQQPNRRSKYTAAAGELAINVARAGLTGILSGRGVNAGTFMGSLHCPVCRLLH